MPAHRAAEPPVTHRFLMQSSRCQYSSRRAPSRPGGSVASGCCVRYRRRRSGSSTAVNSSRSAWMYTRKHNTHRDVGRLRVPGNVGEVPSTTPTDVYMGTNRYFSAAALWPPHHVC